jgi:hypothetical protein
VERDLLGKPVSTFPDHALGLILRACRAKPSWSRSP